MNKQSNRRPKDLVEGQLVWISNRKNCFVWGISNNIFDINQCSIEKSGTPLLVVRKVERKDLSSNWKKYFRAGQDQSIFFSIIKSGWICILGDQLVLVERQSLKIKKEKNVF
jgi:hypothetical protein